MNYTGVTVARRRHDLYVAERWNPWRALRAREHITFQRAALPRSFGGGVCARWPDGAVVIVVDPSLGRRERKVALAHELVHDERGHTIADGMPPGWRAVVAREEILVDREVARRLVPLDELEEFALRRSDADLVTTVHDVAEHFDVTEQMAELAMLLVMGS